MNTTQHTMAESKSTAERNRKHAYPDDLASCVREHWEDRSRDAEGAKDERDDSVPAAPVLDATGSCRGAVGVSFSYDQIRLAD